MRRIVVTAVMLTVSCGSADARPVPHAPRPSETGLSPEFAMPMPKLKKRRSIRLWATYYSVPRAHAKKGGGFLLLDARDRSLGVRLSRPDFCRAAMQGSIEVQGPKGKVRFFSYAGLGKTEVVDCARYYPKHPMVGRSRFIAVTEPIAARGTAAVPYRTIAADPRVLPSGSIVFIPEARGTQIQLPTGERYVHDGFFHVADVGGGVKGNHIDVFLGPRGRNPFAFVKSKPTATVRAFLVDRVTPKVDPKGSSKRPARGLAEAGDRPGLSTDG